MTKQEIIEHCRPSVLPVAAGNLLGSGFYCSDFGLFVTTARLVEEASAVVLTSEHFGRVSARVVYRDPVTDIAFLILPPALPSPGLALSGEDMPHKGAPASAVTCMMSGWPAVHQGSVDRTDTQANGSIVIRTQGITWPDAGNGALLDENGNVMGLTKCELVEGKPNGYAIPASTLREAFHLYQPYMGELALRCPSCRALVLVNDRQSAAVCKVCGTKTRIPVTLPHAPLTGMPGIVEKALNRLGIDILTSRTDIDAWSITDSGTSTLLYWDPFRVQIFAFTHLCNLPAAPAAIEGLYRYLLEENRGLGNSPLRSSTIW